MNLDALIDRASDRFQDPDNRIFSRDEWAEYVNDAYQDVAAAHHDWPFLEARKTLTVPAGSGTVALGTDEWRVTSVYNTTDDYPMTPLDGRSQFRHWFRDGEAAGTPQFYRLRAQLLEVFPKATVNTALSVDLYPGLSTLTANDEPVFPEQFHRILVHGALAYAYDDDGNGPQAQLHRASFDRGTRLLMNYFFAPRAENYPVVIDTF